MVFSYYEIVYSITVTQNENVMKISQIFSFPSAIVPLNAHPLPF